jgi:hypothetical protein
VSAYGVESELAIYYTDDDVRAGGGRTARFTRADVQQILDRLELAGVLPHFEAWRAEDHAGKRGGGRRRFLDDRHILVAVMLLLSEGSPMWVTEIAAVFSRRLVPEARELLGLDAEDADSDPEKDRYVWEWRTRHAYRRLLERFDAWPAPRVLMTVEQRAKVLSLREKNDLRRKEERLWEFSGAMLEMTFKMLPRDVRRAWNNGLTHDQTSMLAVSQRRRFRRDKNGNEIVPEGTKRNGLVLELDADLYPTKLFTRRQYDAASKLAQGKLVPKGSRQTGSAQTREARRSTPTATCSSATW